MVRCIRCGETVSTGAPDVVTSDFTGNSYHVACEPLDMTYYRRDPGWPAMARKIREEVEEEFRGREQKTTAATMSKPLKEKKPAARPGKPFYEELQPRILEMVREGVDNYADLARVLGTDKFSLKPAVRQLVKAGRLEWTGYGRLQVVAHEETEAAHPDDDDAHESVGQPVNRFRESCFYEPDKEISGCVWLLPTWYIEQEFGRVVKGDGKHLGLACGNPDKCSGKRPADMYEVKAGHLVMVEKPVPEQQQKTSSKKPRARKPVRDPCIVCGRQVRMMSADPDRTGHCFSGPDCPGPKGSGGNFVHLTCDRRYREMYGRSTWDLAREIHQKNPDAMCAADVGIVVDLKPRPAEETTYNVRTRRDLEDLRRLVDHSVLLGVCHGCGNRVYIGDNGFLSYDLVNDRVYHHMCLKEVHLLHPEMLVPDVCQDCSSFEDPGCGRLGGEVPQLDDPAECSQMVIGDGVAGHREIVQSDLSKWIIVNC